MARALVAGATGSGRNASGAVSFHTKETAPPVALPLADRAQAPSAPADLAAQPNIAARTES